jgi:hypothetical protein
MSQESPRRPRVLRGTRALAGYVFGDEQKWRSIYPLAHELGLWRWRRQWCGRPETIDARIAEREGRATTDAA